MPLSLNQYQVQGLNRPLTGYRWCSSTIDKLGFVVPMVTAFEIKGQNKLSNF